MWRSQVLARFETHRISNGGTEAVNLTIEKTPDASRTASPPSSTTASESSAPPQAAAPTDDHPPTLQSEEPTHGTSHTTVSGAPSCSGAARTGAPE